MFKFREKRLPPRVNFLPPATKLGQGYIFTGVCDSVNRGDAWLLGGVRGCSWGSMRGCSQGGMRGCSGGACMVAPGGMHGCSWGGMHGCSGGACVVAPRGACMGYDKIRRYDQ